MGSEKGLKNYEARYILENELQGAVDQAKNSRLVCPKKG